MIIIIDNYDSFTFNLVQAIGELGCDLSVFRNDRITVQHIEDLKPQAIVISPGPGRPERAGISMDVIRYFAPRVPILGVCLGHQAISAAFNGRIVHAPRLMHGKTSFIYHDRKHIYRNLDNPFEAARYHSLIIDGKTLPACFTISSWTKEGEIMGIRHKQFPCEGVQFHPESFMTRQGKKLLQNFLRIAS